MLALIVTMLMVGLATSLSRPVVAGPSFPLLVRGYVRDNAGNHLEGAYVTVNLRDGNDVNKIKYTQSDQTDEEGFYGKVAFDPQETPWENGDKVQVIASWHGNLAESWGEANYDPNHPILWINVTYMFEIDEYGSGAIGLVVAGGFVAAVSVVLLTKRKPERKTG